MKTRRYRLMALTLVALTAPACGLSDSALLTACETAIKSELLAPASYRRISVRETAEKIDLQKYLRDHETSPAVRQLLARSSSQPMRGHALIVYDASNAFGVPIRAGADCTYEALDANGLVNADQWLIKIDGKTRNQRLLEHLRPK